MGFDIEDGPRIEARADRPTVGIRLVTPFRGMLAVRDDLIAELALWLADREIEPGGPFFLRLHRVDMAGDMDIEVGVLDTSAADAGDERVRSGTAPAGDYALLAYRGSSMTANKTLLAWAPGQGRTFDSDPESGVWAGRFEILRTDPRVEKRKTAWTVELAFLLRPAG
ncbi:MULTISPECIES: GyrI-like domain-containing protein [unclassified Microbacterium]|uniref:GyrI-like domain-containing protein n=1 Tax=unclassified Microbacterium TaxID=2609290 RepID=UPI0034488D99